jgi:hypothetical protein
LVPLQLRLTNGMWAEAATGNSPNANVSATSEHAANAATRSRNLRRSELSIRINLSILLVEPGAWMTPGLQ